MNGQRACCASHCIAGRTSLTFFRNDQLNMASGVVHSLASRAQSGPGWASHTRASRCILCTAGSRKVSPFKVCAHMCEGNPASLLIHHALEARLCKASSRRGIPPRCVFLPCFPLLPPDRFRLLQETSRNRCGLFVSGPNSASSSHGIVLGLVGSMQGVRNRRATRPFTACGESEPCCATKHSLITQGVVPGHRKSLLALGRPPETRTPVDAQGTRLLCNYTREFPPVKLPRTY